MLCALTGVVGEKSSYSLANITFLPIINLEMEICIVKMGKNQCLCHWQKPGGGQALGSVCTSNMVTWGEQAWDLMLGQLRAVGDK